MKNVKAWIEKLGEYSKCGMCGSEDVYAVITPYPYEYKSELYKKNNSVRGLMIQCDCCGAVASVTAEELEN